MGRALLRSGWAYFGAFELDAKRFGSLAALPAPLNASGRSDRTVGIRWSWPGGADVSYSGLRELRRGDADAPPDPSLTVRRPTGRLVRVERIALVDGV